MPEAYRTVARMGTGEYEEKKSRFLSEVHHVESEEEMNEVLSAVRKKHYDARHHCYACVIGENGAFVKSSDDGEPSGTAGHPILSVIQGENLTDTLVVVTRYFGGTLLGTGGLVRSYTKSAKDGLLHAALIEKKPGKRLIVCADYTTFGKLRYLLESEGYTPERIDYTDKVEMSLPVPREDAETVRKKLTEASAGRAQIEDAGEIWLEEEIH